MDIILCALLIAVALNVRPQGFYTDIYKIIYSTGKVFKQSAKNFEQIKQFVPKFPFLFMSSIPEAFKVQFLFLIRKYEVS